MSFKKIVLLIVLGLFVSGCATIDRFPQVSEKTQQIKSVDIILDVMVVNDIKGEKIGINQEKLKTSLETAKLAVETFFREKNIQINYVHAGHGLFFAPENLSDYVYSKDWESTGQEFDGFKLDNAVADASNKEFLIQAMESAAKYKPETSDKNATIAPLVIANFPESLRSQPSDHLVVIRSYATDIGNAKSIGTGIMTGVISAVISGGTYIAVSTPQSSSVAEVGIFNTNSGELVWHNSGYGMGSKYLAATVEAALQYQKPVKSK